MLVEEVAKNISEIFIKKPTNPKTFAEDFEIEKNKLIGQCSKLTGKTATDFWLSHFVKEKATIVTQTDALDEVMVKLESECRDLAEQLKNYKHLCERQEEQLSKTKAMYNNQIQTTEEESAARESVEKKLLAAKRELMQVPLLNQEIEDWKARHKKAKGNVSDIDAQLKIETQKSIESQMVTDDLRVEIDQLKEEVEAGKELLKKEKGRIRGSALSGSFKNDAPYPEQEKWEPRIQQQIFQESEAPLLEIESELKKILSFEQHDMISKKINRLKVGLGIITGDGSPSPSVKLLSEASSPTKLTQPSRGNSVRSNIIGEKLAPSPSPKPKKAGTKIDLMKTPSAPKDETLNNSLKKKKKSAKKDVTKASPPPHIEVDGEESADDEPTQDKAADPKKTKPSSPSDYAQAKKKKVTIAPAKQKAKEQETPEQKPVIKAQLSQVQTPMSVGMDNDSSVADGLRRGAPSPIVEAMYKNETGAIQFRDSETPNELDEEKSTETYGRQSPIRNAVEKGFMRKVTHEAIKQSKFMPPTAPQTTQNKTVNAKTKTIFQKSQNHQRGPISSQTYSDESANSGEEELSSGDPSKEPINSAHHLNKLQTYDDETLMAMSGDGSLPSMGHDVNNSPLNSAQFVSISENKRPSPAGASPELFGQFMGTSVEQQLMRSLIQKQQSIHTALIVNTARPPVRDSSTQTDVELMLIVAADLFFTELNASIKALKHEETELCKNLKVKNFDQLESLRKQAKQLIGRIKSKAYRGVQIDQKPSITIYPCPGEPDGEIFVDIFEASKSALTGKNTGSFLPEKSWHFANDKPPTQANNKKMLNKDSRPFMLQKWADAEPMSIVTNRLRQRFAVGGSPSPVVLKVNEGNNISLTPTPVQESRTLFGPRVSSPQFRGDQSTTFRRDQSN